MAQNWHSKRKIHVQMVKISTYMAKNLLRAQLKKDPIIQSIDNRRLFWLYNYKQSRTLATYIFEGERGFNT